MNAQLPDLGMDADSLYREEVITDQKIGSIRQMIPVTREGTDDPARDVLYIGSAQMMTPAGALPLSFLLEADNLVDAVAQFGDAARQALERTMEELREMQREAQSSIVVPGQQGPASGGMGGMGGMGGAGGGGIQFP